GAYRFRYRKRRRGTSYVHFYGRVAGPLRGRLYLNESFRSLGGGILLLHLRRVGQANRYRHWIRRATLVFIALHRSVRPLGPRSRWVSCLLRGAEYPVVGVVH